MEVVYIPSSFSNLCPRSSCPLFSSPFMFSFSTFYTGMFNSFFFQVFGSAPTASPTLRQSKPILQNGSMLLIMRRNSLLELQVWPSVPPISSLCLFPTSLSASLLAFLLTFLFMPLLMSLLMSILMSLLVPPLVLLLNISFSYLFLLSLRFFFTLLL